MSILSGSGFETGTIEELVTRKGTYSLPTRSDLPPTEVTPENRKLRIIRLNATVFNFLFNSSNAMLYLHEQSQIPKDCRTVGCSVQHIPAFDNQVAFEFIVTSDEFSEVPEGESIPSLNKIVWCIEDFTRGQEHPQD